MQQSQLSGPEVSVVIPCCNEAENIPSLFSALEKACGEMDREYLFVDDGSTDATGEVLAELAHRHPQVHILTLVRNSGHQSALRAGLKASRGRYVISLDADHQHPPELIPTLVAKAREGYEVVQMVRDTPQKGLFKNVFSWLFYKLFNLLSDVRIPPQGADFRLLNRYACDVLNALPERNLVFRAIIPYLGFRTAYLPFSLHPRFHGKAVFTFRKSLHLGSQALFDFSTLPLRLGYKLGLLISGLAFLYGTFNVAAKFLTDWNVPGYTDIIASILFLGGLIILYQGILGRYLLVLLEQGKNRPEYLIRPTPETAPSPRKPGEPEGDAQALRHSRDTTPTPL